MKKNHIFLLVLFISFSLSGFAQTSKLDSLENALDNAKEDTNKVNLLVVSLIFFGLMPGELQPNQPQQLAVHQPRHGTSGICLISWEERL